MAKSEKTCECVCVFLVLCVGISEGNSCAELIALRLNCKQVQPAHANWR